MLDDWFLLRNAIVDGAWAAAGVDEGAARPGSIPVFAVFFGLFGAHPLPPLLLLAVINAATAILTFGLVGSFVTARRAAGGCPEFRGTWVAVL